MKPSSQSPRTPSRLSDSVQHRLNMYALAARSAGVAFLATVPSVAQYALPVGVAFTGLGVLTEPAEAKIVYTPTNVHLHYSSSYRLDLNQDGVVDFLLGFANVGYSGTCGGSKRSSGGYQQVSVGKYRFQANGIEGKNQSALALHGGAKIGGSAIFSPAELLIKHRFFRSCNGRESSGWNGKWQNVKNRYLGFKFLINKKYHYGWARLTVQKVQGFPPFTALLTGYAYETIPNKPIIAGRTKGPDVITVYPATLGHLAAGASAIPAWHSGK